MSCTLWLPLIVTPKSVAVTATCFPSMLQKEETVSHAKYTKHQSDTKMSSASLVYMKLSQSSQTL